MEVSWGFASILILILFPGLVIRKLYYYGEFSKQFSAGLGLIKLISISSIPGLINLICIFYLYNYLIAEIDIGTVIDTLKDIKNPEYKLQESDDTPLNDKINKSVLPFLGFLYVSSILVGSLSGRLVRITRIDTKFKLLKFKNYWFYLFNNQHTKFKKMRHLNEPNKKHLFTMADILIDTNNKTKLYSGVVVDYELLEGDCQVLSKVMLQNAERYSLKDDKMVPVKIPGNLLVVDCSTLKNINLTFVSEKTSGVLKSKIPTMVEVIFGLLVLILIPFFIFKTDYIDFGFYETYFESPWYEKLLYYLLIIQSISLVNPFVKNEEKEFEFVKFRFGLLKLLWVGILCLLLWLL